jgi:hypothetical protein
VTGSPQALFVSYVSVLGGAERILLDRAGALDGPAAVACPPGPLADAARQAGLDTIELRPHPAELRGGARRRGAAVLALADHAREVRRAVRRLRPGCVVGWSMRGLLAASGALERLPAAPPLVFAQNDLLPSAGVALAVRAAARRCDRVVALSRAIAGELPGPVDVIHPGVDLDAFPVAPLPAQPTVLVLGAIVGWKRPDLALETVALAARSVPGLRLLLAGAALDDAGTALLERLRRRAQAPDLAGRVELPGRAQDAAEAIAGATCLLHCADREPFGLAMVEALAGGRPVVAPAAAGPLEIVEPGCGALYPPGDPVSAAHALVDVIERAPALSAPARERAAQFDAAEANRRFARLIAEVAR